MAKHRFAPRKHKRRYHFPHIRRHHRRDHRLPLSVGVGLATSVLAPAGPGWQSAMSAIQEGKFDVAMQSFVRSWTGVQIGGIGGAGVTQVNLAGLINPLDMTEAPALKATLWTAISAKIVKAVLHKDPLANVPVVKRYVKFA